MVKLTKTQKKRLVNEIEAKAMKLYLSATHRSFPNIMVVDTKDMLAIEKLCKKFRQRLG